jgi:flagellar hook-associated protein 1 FlgK
MTGSLSTALQSSAQAMSVYERAFNVIQNNIANANTPGYVRQEQTLVAMPFDPNTQLSGGVAAGPVVSSRSEYLEQNVRTQQSLLGYAQQKASDLSQVQQIFDLSSVSTSTGSSNDLSGALSNFFNSFSQLSVNPNDATERQSMIDAAQQAAQRFNQSAEVITQAENNADSQTASTVQTINGYLKQIATLNQQYAADFHASEDAGLDAQMHAALENLSTLVNFSTIQSGNGQVNVYLNGETPLVVGSNEYALSADFSSPRTAILDSQGNNVASEITGGKLGGLLSEKNTTLPGYMETLNTLAKTFADQVNNQLAQGLDESGNPPSINLFTYNQASDAAATIAVTGIAPDQIAAAGLGAPGGGGNAVAVSQMATAPLVNGLTFTQSFAGLGTQVGQDVAQATRDQSTYQDLLTQAQQTRSQQTGVSLDAEAAKLIQLQQAYNAVGKMISTLSNLTMNVINLIGPQFS